MCVNDSVVNIDFSTVCLRDGVSGSQGKKITGKDIPASANKIIVGMERAKDSFEAKEAT